MIKEITSKQEWNEVLQLVDSYDFYHTFDYHNISHNPDIEQPILLTYTNKDIIIALPLLLRVIPNTKYFDFVDKCGKEGITVPIIPGLKPIATKKHLNLIPHRFHVDLPEALIKEIVKCKDNSSVREVGVEWCTQQSKELLKAGIPVLHFYSMGKSDNIKAIASQIF